METTKENAFTAGKTAVVKSAQKGGAKESANDVSNVCSIEMAVYNRLAQNLENGDFELKSVTDSVSVAFLNSLTDSEISDYIRKLATANKNVLADNIAVISPLWLSAIDKVDGYTIEERENAKKRFARAEKETENFTITFEDEKSDKTTISYPSGYTFARPTTPTLCGFRVALSSLKIKDSENSRIQSARRAELVETARAFLLNSVGIPAVALDVMLPADVLKMAGKLDKRFDTPAE